MALQRWDNSFVASPSTLDTDGLMIIGDSIVEQNTSIIATVSGGYESEEDVYGAEVWMNALLKYKRFQRLYNYGRSGRRAWQAVLLPGEANYSADDDVRLMLAACPAYDVLVALGTNDMPAAENRTSDQIIADITTVAGLCKAAGRRVAIKSILPRRAADAGYTTAVQQKQLRVNAGIQRLCLEQGYAYIPIAEVLTDYSVLANFVSPATTGRVLYDDVHPNNRGAMLSGIELAAHYSALRTEKRIYSPLHFIDDSSADAENKNLLDNPLFNGTTGYTLLSVAGIVSAVTNTVIASPDGVGNALQVDVTVSGTGFVNLLYSFFDNTPSVYVAGNTLAPVARCKVSANGADTGAPTGLEYVELRCEVTGAGSDSRRAEMRVLGSGGGATTSGQAIDRALDVLLAPTAPYRFTGNEGTTGDGSVNSLFRIAARFLSAGSARFVLFGLGLHLNAPDPYEGRELWK